MKIFLGNAPWRKGNRIGVRAGSRWPFTYEFDPKEPLFPYLPFPFFLAYAAAVLERAGFEVLLVDGIAERLSDQEFLDRIAIFSPHLVLLETSTPSIFVDLNMAKRIKESQNCLIALAGPHTSVFPQITLKENPFVDFILIGEYEYTLLELARAVKEEQNLYHIKGICFRDKRGEPVVNDPREPISDLDQLPWPARHFLPMLNYRDPFCGIPEPSLQMWASRGCPYHCIFCLWPSVIYNDHHYRTRDPINVVEEMSFCIEQYGFKSVFFDDDTFNLGKKRILALCQEIKRSQLNIPWAIMARADTSDTETLEQMVKSGLYAIKYGVESGSQEILDKCGKNLKLDRVRETVKLTKSLGIKVHLTFAFGFPEESADTIKKTIDLALELDPNSVQFSLITPFPGTPYYSYAKEKGLLLSENWADYDGSNISVIRTEKLSAADLQKALDLAYQAWSSHCTKKKFFSHPFNYIKKGILNPKKAFDFMKKVFFFKTNLQK